MVLILSACSVFTGRESTSEYVDDASITASVKNQILQDPKLSGFQIHVETFKNQVQLSGFVDTSAEVARAGQIAREVPGVQDVKNSIVVRKKGYKATKRHKV
jgi:osmotically-inducible protein OsmY